MDSPKRASSFNMCVERLIYKVYTVCARVKAALQTLNKLCLKTEIQINKLHYLINRDIYLNCIFVLNDSYTSKQKTVFLSFKYK